MKNIAAYAWSGMPLETAVAKVSGRLTEPAELIDSMDGSQVSYSHPFASVRSRLQTQIRWAMNRESADREREWHGWADGNKSGNMSHEVGCKARRHLSAYIESESISLSSFGPPTSHPPPPPLR